MTEQKEQRKEFINEKTPKIHGDSKWYRNHMKGRLAHAYMRTDGSFDWPNSLEGDLLRLTRQLLVVLDQEESEPAQSFKIGEYYVSENKQIYKLLEYQSEKGVWRRVMLLDDLTVVYYVSDEEVQQDRKATTEEIALFKRAEHFHKHGRKLNELKQGDLIEHDNQLNIVGPDTSYGYVRVDVRGNTHSIGEAKEVKLIMTAEELEAAATNMK